MPTTCPKCGAGSPGAADSCASCGHALYRLRQPVRKTSFRLISGISRGWMLAVTSAVILLLGAGVSTAFLLGFGDDDGMQGRAKPSGPTVTPTPRPSVTPSSPKPTRTKPPKPEPTRQQPRPSTPPRAEPTSQPPVHGIPSEVRRRLEEQGIDVDEHADPTDAREWHVDRNGNVNVSP